MKHLLLPQYRLKARNEETRIEYRERERDGKKIDHQDKKTRQNTVRKIESRPAYRK